MINQNWIFGNSAGITFNSASPSSINVPNPVGERRFSTWEGCTSVSDANGNLLFYTEGKFIWKSDGTTIKNGTADYQLKGDKTSSQSAIIVPDPGNDKQYYILTADGSSFGHDGVYNHFNGVLINVDTWNITEIIPNLISTPPPTDNLSPAEKITVIRAPNCKDFWVLTAFQEVKSNATKDLSAAHGPGLIQIYKINAAGISFIEQVQLNVMISDVGYMKSSHDGKVITIASTTLNKVDIFPFDNTLGKIDVTPTTLKIGSPYGLEFSPNNQILYISRIGYKKPKNLLSQVDMTQTSLSDTLVGTFNRQPGQKRHVIGTVQLGPDNKIYIARDQYNKVGVIHEPNVLGVGCNIDIDYITLATGTCQIGLPNLVSHLCPPDDCDCCDCSCPDCNKDATSQNKELIERAKTKLLKGKSSEKCVAPFAENCEQTVAKEGVDLTPCFSFHIGDSNNEKVPTSKTSVFYLTVCNPFTDVQYNGLKITKVSLFQGNSKEEVDLDLIQIVPDRFISMDCLKPCSCQTREFALIAKDKSEADKYRLEVEYCYEELVFVPHGGHGSVKFSVEVSN